MTKVKKETKAAVSTDAVVSMIPAGLDISQFKTKTSLIKHLSGTGMKRADIARVLNEVYGDRTYWYQYVRNILTAPVKKGS